jgi:hypothetical protein
VCNEFVGLYCEVHHIVQEADGGENTLANSIVLCLRCHGEVGHYNRRHPIGNKYSTSELIAHRDNWWKWCEENPAVPLPKLPILVSPSEATIVSGGWTRKTILKIFNRSDRIYHDVWVKLDLTLRNVSPDSVTIADSKIEQALIASAGPLEIRGDAFMFMGTEPNGQNVVYILINSLEPQNTVAFLVGADPQLDLIANEDQFANVKFSVESFNPEPEGAFMQTQGVKVARTLRVPANFTIQRVAFKTGGVGRNAS